MPRGHDARHAAAPNPARPRLERRPLPPPLAPPATAPAPEPRRANTSYRRADGDYRYRDDERPYRPTEAGNPSRMYGYRDDAVSRRWDNEPELRDPRLPLPPDEPRPMLPAIVVLCIGLVLSLTVVYFSGNRGNENETNAESAAAVSPQSTTANADDEADAGATTPVETTPAPTPSSTPAPPPNLPVGALPPGGPITDEGSDTYRRIDAPGPVVGTGKKLYTYVIEVEETIPAEQYGGDEAFARMVDATLADPRSWINEGKVSFQPLGAASEEKPDLRIQLSSTATTAQVCGNSYGLETSCYMRIGNRVMINQARWVRGALTFGNDLKGYRQYVINHEVGHGIGFARHEPCTGKGELAPVMMQQTVSLSNSQLREINPEDAYKRTDATCIANPWPFPAVKKPL